MLRIPEEDILHLIELRDVYDGWSVVATKDGRFINRWANDDGSGPEPGYERRWAKTEEYIDIIHQGEDAA